MKQKQKDVTKTAFPSSDPWASVVFDIEEEGLEIF